MLFRLVVQKYPELSGTIFQDQVNDFLLSEGAPQFPFDLSLAEIKAIGPIKINTKDMKQSIQSKKWPFITLIA